MRASRLPPGQARTRLPLILLEGSEAPKTQILRAIDVPVGPEWTMAYASARAIADLPPGGSTIVVQLGQAAHALELGPALLFDFGPDHDPARMPRNPID